MNHKKIKNIPFILMLSAGSITSIMTYIFQYEIKTALLVLLSVLLVFYCLGLLLIRVIQSFDEKIEEERKAKELEEGVLLEKEETAQEQQNNADE